MRPKLFARANMKTIIFKTIPSVPIKDRLGKILDGKKPHFEEPIKNMPSSWVIRTSPLNQDESRLQKWFIWYQVQNSMKICIIARYDSRPGKLRRSMLCSSQLTTNVCTMFSPSSQISWFKIPAQQQIPSTTGILKLCLHIMWWLTTNSRRDYVKLKGPILFDVESPLVSSLI